MPLLVNREHVSHLGHSVSCPTQKGSLDRIVSDMNVSPLQSDSVGLSGFMREISTLFGKDQNRSFGAEDSANKISQQPQHVW
jgi:hypothetical protein